MIRHEQQTDSDAVFNLHAGCFPTDAEANLVNALRASATPLISLVAVVNHTVVGHVLFSPVTMANYSGLLMGLAPVAVLPEHQRKGIGSALIKAGLQQCQRLNATCVVVLGEPDYYARFGFVPAVTMGISSTYDVPSENFMVLKTGAGQQAPMPGIVHYHRAFADL